MGRKQDLPDGQIWKHQILKDILKKTQIDHTLKRREHRGGDYDLDTWAVELPGEEDCLLITPFHSTAKAAPRDADDGVSVVAIEISNLFSDSAGGCQTDNEDLGSLYGLIRSNLRAAGFRIIGHHDEIF